MQRRGFYASPPHLMSKGIATGRWLLLFHQIPPKRSEEHTSELQSQSNLVCRLLLEKKKRPAVRSSPCPDSVPHYRPARTPGSPYCSVFTVSTRYTAPECRDFVSLKPVSQAISLH